MDSSNFGEYSYGRESRFKGGIAAAWICTALFALQIFFMFSTSRMYEPVHVIRACVQFAAVIFTFRCGFQPRKSMMNRKPAVIMVIAFAAETILAAMGMHQNIEAIKAITVDRSNLNFESFVILTDLILLYFPLISAVSLILFAAGRYSASRIFACVSVGLAALKTAIQTDQIIEYFRSVGVPDTMGYVAYSTLITGIFFLSMLIETITFIVYLSRYPLSLHPGYAKQGFARPYEQTRNRYSGTSSASPAITAPAAAARDRHIIRAAVICLAAVALISVTLAVYYRSHFGVYELSEYDRIRKEAFTADVPEDPVPLADGSESTIKMPGRDVTIKVEGVGKGIDGRTYLVAEVSNRTHSTVGMTFKSQGGIGGRSVPLDYMTFISEPGETVRIKIAFDELAMRENRIRKIHEINFYLGYFVGKDLHTYISNPATITLTFDQEAEYGEHTKDYENVSDDYVEVYFQGVLADPDYNNRVNLVFYIENNSGRSIYTEEVKCEPEDMNGASYSDAISLESGTSGVFSIHYYLDLNEELPDVISVTLPYGWYDSSIEKHEKSVTLQIDTSHEFKD